MDTKPAVLSAPDESDATLATRVAGRIGMELPPECVPGVAFNARLLERHIATMRENAE